ncbi:ribokinase [Thiofilum flexile]|uniref:ribokinase n=1 Tax=Thiofilum flexile TaxID=125627 RepID=UPI00036C2ABD|nr:ribokinase [Thiofilum flexile]
MQALVLGSYVQAHCVRVEQLPQSGESVAAKQLWIEHGGKGLNLALGMQRLGVSVELLVAAGTDGAGQTLITYLQQEGLNTQNVLILEGASGFGVGLVTEAGQNIIAVYAGANARLNAQHIEAAYPRLATSQLVCAQFEIPEEPIIRAFELARGLGIPTLLNPSPWRKPSKLLETLTDIWVLNETEASQLFQLGDVSEWSSEQWLANLTVLNWSGKLLIVTLAAQGCVAVEKTGNTYHIPAKAITLQDPTGAGDAFTAGLVYALLTQQPLPLALQVANTCGAYVAAHAGVLTVLPTLAQLQTFEARD